MPQRLEALLAPEEDADTDRKKILTRALNALKAHGLHTTQDVRQHQRWFARGYVFFKKLPDGDPITVWAMGRKSLDLIEERLKFQ